MDSTKRQTVKVPVDIYREMTDAKNEANKSRKAGNKLTLPEFMFLKFKESQNVVLAQPAPAAVIEKAKMDTDNNPEVEIDVHENQEDMTMGDCPNCTAREIEMQRIKGEVIPGIQEKASKRETELVNQVAELTLKLKEKPEPVAADAIPEDLETVIEHCENGNCAAHQAQWQRIQARVLEAYKPGIVEEALKNLPKSFIEQQALEMGLIPKRIIISSTRK